jgi:hypothetical protein
MFGLGRAMAILVCCGAGTALADEAKKIDCSATDMKFEAPGFTVSCKDYSRSSVSTGETLAASNSYSLFAVSEADLTFLDAFSDRVLGSVYYSRQSMQSDLEDYYKGKFTKWARQDDIGDYEIGNVTASFGDDEPMECVAFRKLGARRYEGVNGVTVGVACSDNGRDKALEAVKLFVAQDD